MSCNFDKRAIKPWGLALHRRPLLGERSQVCHRGRDPGASGHEGLMRCADEVGAQSVPPAVEVHDNGLDLCQIPHQVGPGDLHPACLLPSVPIHLQPQRQKAGDEMADAGVITMMEARAHFQRRLLHPEHPFHPPQPLIPFPPGNGA
jgi:hypothetical protein